MPYIKRIRREQLDVAHLDEAGYDAQSPGELNYLISKVCDEYIRRRRPVGYRAVNEAIGALECAKLELYRRIAAPYEDGKMAENGDVYTVNTER